MEDKLRIANKVNKKYKELMNELDENIKQATEDIGNDEAKALLENRKNNLTVEKSGENLQCVVHIKDISAIDLAHKHKLFDFRRQILPFTLFVLISF